MAALLSLATRVKYGKGYWWRHSIIGYCLLGLLGLPLPAAGHSVGLSDASRHLEVAAH